MVLQSLVRLNAAKRIPLIKFRKGGNASQASSSQTQAVSPPSSASTPKIISTPLSIPGPPPASAPNAKPQPAKKALASSGPAIEDWELPRRYARKQPSEEEMDYINRGGPA